LTTKVFERCFKATTALGLVSGFSVVLREELVRGEFTVGKPVVITVNVTTEVRTSQLPHASPTVGFAHDASVS
jgi:hypothetical protein